MGRFNLRYLVMDVIPVTAQKNEQENEVNMQEEMSSEDSEYQEQMMNCFLDDGNQEEANPVAVSSEKLINLESKIGESNKTAEIENDEESMDSDYMVEMNAMF